MKIAVSGQGKLTKRDKILHSARQLFLSEGYAGLSMNGLIRVAGGSKATLYAHFSNKDELFDAVLERILPEAQPSLELPAQADRQPAAYLQQVADFYLTQLDQADTLALIRTMLEAERCRAGMSKRVEEVMILRFADQLASVLSGHDAPVIGWQQYSHNFIRSLFALFLTEGLLHSGDSGQLAGRCLQQAENTGLIS